MFQRDTFYHPWINESLAIPLTLWFCDSEFHECFKSQIIWKKSYFQLKKMCWVYFKVMDRKIKLINYEKSELYSSVPCLKTYLLLGSVDFMFVNTCALLVYTHIPLSSLWVWGSQSFVLCTHFLSEAVLDLKAVWTFKGLTRAVRGKLYLILFTESKTNSWK